MLTYILILIGLILLIIKPYHACIFLYFLVIANINIETGIEGFNFRSLFTIAVIIRFMFMGTINSHSISKLISNKYIILFLLIRIFFYLTSSLNGLNNFENFKWLILDLTLILITFILFEKKQSSVLFISILISGITCVGDLLYTYLIFDGFPIRRIIGIIFSENGEANHNFHGYICGVSLIVALYLIISYRHTKKIKFLLYSILSLYGIGVILSTSRSALLGLFAFLLFYLFNNAIRTILSKISIRIFLVAIILLPLSLIVIHKFNRDIITNIEKRIIDEPVAMFSKLMGNSYESDDLDSGEWREESSLTALINYGKLSTSEKITGIGRGGYINRNLGDGLSTHNGYLLILIEYGLIGFLSYVALLFIVLIKNYKYRYKTPYFFLMIYILFYSLPQNEELIGTLMSIVIMSNIYTSYPILIKKKISNKALVYL